MHKCLSNVEEIKQPEIPITNQDIIEALSVTEDTIREVFSGVDDQEDIDIAIERFQDVLLEAAPMIRRIIQDIFEEQRQQIDTEELATAISFVDTERAGTLFNPSLDNVERILSGTGEQSLRQDIKTALQSGGILGAAIADFTIGRSLSFDVDDFILNEWVAKHTAELVTQIKFESKLAIRNVIRRTLIDGATPEQAAIPVRKILRPDDLADHMVNTMGLTRRQARAVDRFLSKQLEEGVPPEIALRRTRQYSDRLLAQRAERITRTEIITAINRGQQFSFEQMARAGIIDTSVWGKRWLAILDDRTCPVCRPMDGKVVEIRTQFRVDVRYTDGGEVVRQISLMVPPSHPLCRCTLILERLS